MRSGAEKQELLTVAELPRVLRRSEQSVRLDIKRGRMPAVKTGPRGSRIYVFPGEAARAMATYIPAKDHLNALSIKARAAL